MTDLRSSPRRTVPLVLVVDDIPENLQVIGNLLDSKEVEVALVTSGAQALQFVAEDPPDLVLLDVTMPDMTGFEVCRRLKRDLATSTIPVIFVTARTDTEDVVEGFAAGGVDYVTKPFRPAELRARVRTHIQLHRLRSLLSICSYCNKIRDERNEWVRIEAYLYEHTGTSFSHGICPECAEAHFGKPTTP